MEVKTCSYRSIVRASGIYDIMLMIPFAIPGVVSWLMMQLEGLHNTFELAGTFPEFSPFHLFFVNLMAIVTIVWSVLRVLSPTPEYGLYDSVARVLIALLMLVYLLFFGVTEILWFFFLSEVVWAILQINGHFTKRSDRIAYRIHPV